MIRARDTAPAKALTSRPPGALTLDEVRERWPQANAPVTTLRTRLRGAAIGAWSPPGKRSRTTLYDEHKAEACLREHPPTRRRTAPTAAGTRPRARKSSSEVAYALPEGWAPLKELALEVGRVRPSHATDHIRRWNETVARTVRDLSARELATLRALEEAFARSVFDLTPVPTSDCVLNGRRQVIAPSVQAKRAFSSAPLTKDYWRPWVDAVLETPPGASAALRSALVDYVAAAIEEAADERDGPSRTRRSMHGIVARCAEAIAAGRADGHLLYLRWKLARGGLPLSHLATGGGGPSTPDEDRACAQARAEIHADRASATFWFSLSGLVASKAK